VDDERSPKKANNDKTPSKSTSSRGGKRQPGKTTSKQSEQEEGGIIQIFSLSVYLLNKNKHFFFHR
jgi:hypothetical protein